MGALDGKVAIVTGGISGIGARTAELFVSEGAKVVIAGRRREVGEGIAKRLGPATRFIRTDVANEPEVKAMIDGAVATYGRLDCLVNNAGVRHPPIPAGTVVLQPAVASRLSTWRSMTPPWRPCYVASCSG
jgi:NAD(P)-dependent dehydrogenase (short-subunit alcohol dehydrogenase family)